MYFADSLTSLDDLVSSSKVYKAIVSFDRPVIWFDGVDPGLIEHANLHKLARDELNSPPAPNDDTEAKLVKQNGFSGYAFIWLSFKFFLRGVLCSLLINMVLFLLGVFY